MGVEQLALKAVLDLQHFMPLVQQFCAFPQINTQISTNVQGQSWSCAQLSASPQIFQGQTNETLVSRVGYSA